MRWVLKHFTFLKFDLPFNSALERYIRSGISLTQIDTLSVDVQHQLGKIANAILLPRLHIMLENTEQTVGVGPKEQIIVLCRGAMCNIENLGLENNYYWTW